MVKMKKMGWRVISESESEPKSEMDEVIDSDKEEAERRYTICIKRDIPCVWNKVSSRCSLNISSLTRDTDQQIEKLHLLPGDETPMSD